jgi:hypothetical protein
VRFATDDTVPRRAIFLEPLEGFVNHFVSLNRLPAGLQIPAELQDRFQYEPDARRLTHSGFMSKAEFDRLYLLSEDWGYRRALEELFRLCTGDGNEHPRGLRKWLRPLFGDSPHASA